jgi:hypothetical protein
MQLEEGWVDWTNPQCWNSPEWDNFTARQKRYSEFPDDLRDTLQQVDAVWVIEQGAHFQFGTTYKFTTRLGP